jgi:hypothetical protein
VDGPDRERVAAFLPDFQSRQVLGPDEPVSIGAMVGPEAFTEARSTESSLTKKQPWIDVHDPGMVQWL